MSAEDVQALIGVRLPLLPPSLHHTPPPPYTADVDLADRGIGSGSGISSSGHSP